MAPSPLDRGSLRNRELLPGKIGMFAQHRGSGEENEIRLEERIVTLLLRHSRERPVPGAEQSFEW
jgi:hypothetical protein